MKYAVTSSEMRGYDRNTSEYFGVSTEVLMERASLAVANAVDEWIEARNISRKYNALIFAGVGNNGGDGVCTARLLKLKGYNVTLCVVGDMTRCSDLCLKQLKIAEHYGISVKSFTNIRENSVCGAFDVIIDALFGIGLSRIVSGDYAKAIEYINECKEERQNDLFVVSVDIASGINADNGKVMGCAVKADKTVTFNFAKLGHLLYPGCEYSGKLVIEDVGIGEESFLDRSPEYIYCDEAVSSLMPGRRKDSNKGTNGKILIIAGSRNISGALILAAGAALKSGAGMVRVFTDIANAEAVKTLLPEVIIDTYSEMDSSDGLKSKLQMLFDWSTALVLGPGLGTNDFAESLVRWTLEKYDKNLVADADALNLIAGSEKLKNLLSNYARNGKRLVLTPHLAEFARLYGCDTATCKENILEYPRLLAGKLHCTVVCKDARTIVADMLEKKIYINMSGNDGMATAGSGDVLSGIMGYMISVSDSSFDAACAAVYLHGCAGDIAADSVGRPSMVASDIVSHICDAIVR